jgi:hypothetical protein
MLNTLYFGVIYKVVDRTTLYGIAVKKYVGDENINIIESSLACAVGVGN